jgi:transposase, IS5 family
MSYKSKDRMSGSLFSELLPFGGKLNIDNRWIRKHDLIPWFKLEEIYRKYFSNLGRPGKDSQLINGLLIVKHEMVLSDVEVVELFLENPYVQYFCGYDQFVVSREIEASTLARVRKRLGVEYFRKFEDEILKILKSRKIIKDNEQMIDATVFPSNVTYPTDTGLIENARQWVVEVIKKIIKAEVIKKKIRTYCRKARRVYLRFQKKRRHSDKEIRKTKKQLLQYVRRNISQLRDLLTDIKEIPQKTLSQIKDRLIVAEKIYWQQLTMLKKRTRSIENRVVSFHRSEIRPIVRGKSGKDVEFGPKASLSCVDGYLFLDKFSYEAFHEGAALKEDLSEHKRKFDREPEVVITDKIYGSLENRKMLKEKGIKASLIPLGRKCERSKEEEKWVRLKQNKRSEIEGKIGIAKVHYGLERVLYKNEEIGIRMGLLAMNLTTAMARI